MNLYPRYVKRILDFILSFVAIVVLSPMMLFIAFFVRQKLGSPVIFKQLRPGKNEKIFEMYKFRSMTDERDSEGNLLSDEARLTRFGRKLRDSSLDELPELFNILRGDMSVVGPRPQLVRDMVFMTAEQRQRHRVRQGLTGLAQVNGRNGISWEEKLKYDLEYVQCISFLTDIKIIFETVKAVFCREGITMEGMATAEDFGDYLLKTGRVTQTEYLEKQKEAEKLCAK